MEAKQWRGSMKSILSEQREADEELCERLVALAYVAIFDRRHSDSTCFANAAARTFANAAARIRALSAALQESCHERDGLLAKVERHAS
jgi:hypothetical protein